MGDRTDTERLDFFEQHGRDCDFRLVGKPTICGTYPRWHFWSGNGEKTHRKTFREAIDAAMDAVKESGDDPSNSPAPESDHCRKILERVLSKLKHHHMSRAGIRALVDNAEGAMGLVSENDRVELPAPDQ